MDNNRALFYKYIPANAQAVIVAEYHKDESDSMTDYFAHTTTETIIIGYSMHKKDLFSEMRKAAARIPETAHLGPGMGRFEPRVMVGEDVRSNGAAYWKGSYSHWHRELTTDGSGNNVVFRTREEAQAYIDAKGTPGEISFEGVVIPFYWDIKEEKVEHREKWSMGSGYYLKDGHSNASGWCVRKVKKWRDEWDSYLFASMGNRCVFTEKPEPPNNPTCKTTEAQNDITVTENTEKNGVEIRFKNKPAQEVLDTLKAHGWRWSRFSVCWYNKNTPENVTFAHAFTLSVAAENPQAETKGAPDIAAKLRTLADGMEKAIDGKMNSAIGQQNPTRRRLMIAAEMRKEGEQLQSVQFLLRSLADMHEAGSVPPELARITTKAAAHKALFGYSEKIQSAVDIANGKPQEDPKAKTLRDLDRELIGCKIPGFFVTPKETAQRLVELADIREGMDVLEPEAGRGDIAEHINHGSNLTCIEYQQRLAEILKLRGFNTICGDFLEHHGTYDRIVMNPPFENFQDIAHVRHAYDCLKDGGRLVSVMGESAFFRSDRIPTDFRAWLDDTGAETIDLPAGSFSGTITSTGVKTRIVVIDK